MLNIQGVAAQVCTNEHFQNSVKEVWKVLEYLRKQLKMSRPVMSSVIQSLWAQQVYVQPQPSQLTFCLSKGPE